MSALFYCKPKNKMAKCNNSTSWSHILVTNTTLHFQSALLLFVFLQESVLFLLGAGGRSYIKLRGFDDTSTVVSCVDRESEIYIILNLTGVSHLRYGTIYIYIYIYDSCMSLRGFQLT